MSKEFCVIIPTFNNSDTLESIINDAFKICQNIIVVNDGSTDETSNIIHNLKDKITVIKHLNNIGKGKSLRNAFKYAIKKKFKYAITIDSDGQHDPKEISLFMREAIKNPNSILLGARNMNQFSVPKKSSFGNKFSNFWFLFETGISLSDTQTGFRLYPLEKLKNIKFFSKKFEFEIEILVRMAWKNVPIKEIPISVKYAENRISHFRPLKDFLRISALNTILVTVALIYFIPIRLFNYFKTQIQPKKIYKDFLSQDGSIIHKSLSVGLGTSIAILPIWGFQTLIAILIAYIFRLNKILVLLFSNISIPPLIPFILFISYYIGNFIIGGKKITFSKNIQLVDLQEVLFQYLIGSISLSIMLGSLFFILSFVLLNLMVKKNNNE